MGLFDFLKRKKRVVEKQTVDEKQHIIINQSTEKAQQWPSNVRLGKAVAEEVRIENSVEQVRNRFIAFDVETTGLSPLADRIIEIGAVLFVNGKPTNSYSTLVNPLVSIPASASAVNHITNGMIKSAPIEQRAYPCLIEFLGDALAGDTIMCAHNARFDFDFLCNTLSRLGFDADIRFVDTLSLSRKYVRGLENYKQGTLEAYFGLTNNAAHRASSDAENCGKILCSILDTAAAAIEVELKQIEQNMPTQEELAICAYIQRVIEMNGGDTYWLRYRKNSSNYVDATYLYTFLKFKFSKKGKYIIVNHSTAEGIELPQEACSVSEGGTTCCRLYFNKPSDLEPLSQFIFRAYSDCYKSMQSYVSSSNHAKREAEKSIKDLAALSRKEVENLLLEAEYREYDSTPTKVQVEPVITRSDVIVKANHCRVPLSEIRNRGNIDKGYHAGFSFWERGEEARIEGRLDEAIGLFDQARFNGYEAPALYESYAKAFRQLKDYDNEIVILEEALERMANHRGGEWEARRSKAIKLLYTKQKTERKAQEKAHTPVQKKNECEQKALTPKKVQGRAIIQMTDDGTVIEEFETVSAAAENIGVSTKSIRDAANGIQKHAGGYCWRYRNLPQSSIEY